eukprot:RCo002267
MGMDVAYIKELLLRMSKIAWPTSLFYLASYAGQTIAFMTVAQLGSLYMAGFALGLMTVNLTGVAIVIGLLNGMDTLCAQAFGARNFNRIGVLLQRGLLTVGIWYIAAVALWLNSEKLLLLCGQEPEVARLASIFAKGYLFALPARMGMEGLSRFLRCQNVVLPVLWVAVATLPFHVFWCWMLTFHMGLGILGASLALGLNLWLQLSLLVGYCWWRRPHVAESWTGWSRSCLNPAGLREYLSFAVPGVLMTTMSWISMEVMSLVVGTMGTAMLAAHSVLALLDVTVYTFFWGFSIATNVLVGQQLGEGQPEQAKRTGLFAFGVGTLMAMVVMGVIVLLREYVVLAFNREPAVVSLFCNTVWVLFLYNTAHVAAGQGQGVLKGAGKQMMGSCIVFAGNYVVGIPLSLCLAFFTSMGLPAVWGGMTMGYTTMTFLYLAAVWWMDWPKASQTARAKALARASQAKMQAIPDDNRSDAPSGADGLPNPLLDGEVTPSPTPGLPSRPFPSTDFERVGDTVVLVPIGAPSPSSGGITPDPEPQLQPSQGAGARSPVEPTS